MYRPTPGSASHVAASSGFAASFGGHWWVIPHSPCGLRPPAHVLPQDFAGGGGHLLAGLGGLLAVVLLLRRLDRLTHRVELGDIHHGAALRDLGGAVVVV